MLFRTRTRPELVASREQSKRTVVEWKCPTCNGVVIRQLQHDMRGQPTTMRVLVEQAMRKHMAETGCSGEAKSDAK